MNFAAFDSEVSFTQSFVAPIEAGSDLNLSNLKSVPDSQLIFQVEKLVHQERELLLKVLHHLREIDRRRLFSSLGYKSLFDFAVRHLGYPEDQAYRRISAMKLLKELPEIETQISNGQISLTHIGLAQSLFRQEKKIHHKEFSTQEKLSVFEKMASLPVRDAEKVTLSFSSAPALAKPDRVHLVSPDQVEIKFLASTEIQKKIETLKGRLAHQHPNLTLGELFDRLCDWGLERLDPSVPRKKKQKAAPDSDAPTISTTLDPAHSKPNAHVDAHLKPQSEPELEVLADADAAPDARASAPDKTKAKPKTAAPRKRRVNKASASHETVSAKNRRQVSLRAQNKCENCGSEYALEVDHIRPLALGGTSDLENLRLLCRHCNQRAAIQNLGIQKMQAHLG